MRTAAAVVCLTLPALVVRTIRWTPPSGPGLGRYGYLGVVLFAEPLTAWRVTCLLLIVGGGAGLKSAAQ